MATLTLSIPDAVFRRASARLGRHGKGEIQEFLLSALEALAMEGRPIDAVTEAKLLKGLESPLIKATDAHWRAKLKRYDARRRKRDEET